MVTLNKVGGHNNTKQADFFGKSHDDKPTEFVPNGSSFYEIDTSVWYLFDKENKVWHEQ